MNHISEQGKLAAGEGRRAEQRILRMTPDGKSAASIEVVLHKRIDEISQAIRDKNLDRLMTFYATDVEVFDLMPPLNTRGAAEYRKNFERWFGSFEGAISFELVELRIAAGEGVAFCHYLSLVTGARPDGRKSGYWARGTTCLNSAAATGW